MSHQKLIKLPWKLERAAPNFEGNDIKSPEGLIRHILKKYTKRGHKIFDPFVGLGTTMFVAEEMGRIPFGIEAEQQKYEWVAGQLENWTHLIHDDAAKIARYNLPKMDLVITSPPYMPRHHKWNPLFSGDPAKAGYQRYLKQLRLIFSKIQPIMKANAKLVIQADNLHHGPKFTPLVHDIAETLSRDFIQIDETKVLWTKPKPDYPFTQYLVFKKKA